QYPGHHAVTDWWGRVAGAKARGTEEGISDRDRRATGERDHGRVPVCRHWCTRSCCAGNRSAKRRYADRFISDQRLAGPLQFAACLSNGWRPGAARLACVAYDLRTRNSGRRDDWTSVCVYFRLYRLDWNTWTI